MSAMTSGATTGVEVLPSGAGRALLQTTSSTNETCPQGCITKPHQFDVQARIGVTVIILVCRFIGLLFKAVKLPAVIGEILAGILLGPSGMGQIAPDPGPGGAFNPHNPTAILFPYHEKLGPSNTRNYLNVLAQLGVVVFMFVVGLEVDIPKLKQTSSVAAAIAVASVALPFVLGAFWLGPDLHTRHSDICPLGVPHGSSQCAHIPLLPFQLFVGVSMSVTAFPVLARIITEHGLQKLQLGSTTLACAALNDVVAWALLTVCLAVNAGGGYTSVPKMIGLILAVGLGEWLLVGPLMRITALNHFKRVGHLSPNRLAWVMVGMLLSAWLVHFVGFHAMLGAFLFGLVFPRGHGTPFLYTILQRVEAFATIVLLPIFFLVTGLSIDLSKLHGRAAMDLLFIVITACAGKFIGASLTAKLCGMGWRHTIAIGVMMNTRGLTEVVVLNIARDAGIIDDQLFTALVLMAVITTAMAGPLLSLIFPHRQLVLEKQRDVAAAAAARGGALDASTARIVVLVHEVRRGGKLLDAAVSTLTSPHLRAHLDIAQFLRPANVHSPTELGTGNLTSPQEVGNRKILRDAMAKVRRRYLTSTVTVRVVGRAEERLPETQLHIQAAAPQLVVTDWPRGEEERSMLRTLVVEAPCTVVLWGGYSPTAPPELGRSPSSSAAAGVKTAGSSGGGSGWSGAAAGLDDGAAKNRQAECRGEAAWGPPGPPLLSSSARSLGGGDASGRHRRPALVTGGPPSAAAAAAALPPSSPINQSPRGSPLAGAASGGAVHAVAPLGTASVSVSGPAPPSFLDPPPPLLLPPPPPLSQQPVDEGVGAEASGEQEGEEIPEKHHPAVSFGAAAGGGGDDTDDADGGDASSCGGSENDGGGDAGGDDGDEEGGDGGAPPRRREWSLTKLPREERGWAARLRRLLTDEAFQDALAEALLDDLWACCALLRARVPGLRGSGASDDNDDNEGDDGGGGEHLRERERDVIAKEAAEHMAGGSHGGAAVASAAQSKVVTAESMAMTAAAALSPKFSKLIVCGWPSGHSECAALMRFVHGVEHDVQRRATVLERQRTLTLQRTPSAVPFGHHAGPPPEAAASAFRGELFRTRSVFEPAPGSGGGWKAGSGADDELSVLPPLADHGEFHGLPSPNVSVNVSDGRLCISVPPLSLPAPPLPGRVPVGATRLQPTAEDPSTMGATEPDALRISGGGGGSSRGVA